MAESNLMHRLLQLVKTINTSLRLKDVLEAAVKQFSDLTGNGKVAIFLSDNDSLSLKLMNSSGYSEASLEQLRIIPFSTESILKQVVQKRQVALVQDIKQAPGISADVMGRELSLCQIALPLIASNLFVGLVLIDAKDIAVVNMVDLLRSIADLVAQAVANSILFGRSEYERERLGTLYKTSVSLSSSALKVSEVLQIASDTSLILANTNHCAVLLYDHLKKQFVLAAFKGLDGSNIEDFDLSAENTIAGKALQSKKNEYVPDSSSYQLTLPRSSGGLLFGSVLAIPLLNEDEGLGVIMLFSQEQRAFHREQIELLDSLAKQVSIALHIALTHENTASQTLQDAHTGLYNPWHFSECLSKELERSQRHNHYFAIMRIDIDHLSRVNELLGNGKGDEAIKHVSHLIKHCLRDIDIPCRYGSQEFAIILPETTRQAALEVAERLRSKIRAESAPGVGLVTVSVGLSSYPENGHNPAEILKAAEQALDIAKFEGRDRIKAAPISADKTASLSWEELAQQARLSIVSERQSKLTNRLQVSSEYAPWMRAIPNWNTKKKE